ncbi:MAG TPA: LuxR C-terminal-related transcriptional regulator, partial [Nocardioides sp.]|nr:LuxR C-terminal-related transcriptional regulator [Nocardioides sp.]
GQLDRARVLVERVLRSAAAEQLRRPLTRDGAWLRWFLDRSGTATREHRRFVRSLVARDTVVRSPEPHSVGPAPLMTNPLTEREGQVLELVAQLCTTDEIAAEMYLSVNTVKTHLSSIFRKFGVSRRGDAVRRGRELGLC